MGCVIFDFDSTLISVESLDEILSSKVQSNQELTSRLRSITDRGMSGDLPFSESLRLRLELVRPVLEDVRAFGNRARG